MGGGGPSIPSLPPPPPPAAPVESEASKKEKRETSNALRANASGFRDTNVTGGALGESAAAPGKTLLGG